MWKDLSLRDKAAFMKVAINNGIYDLKDIQEHYNKFAEGGEKDSLNKSESTESKVSTAIMNFLLNEWRRKFKLKPLIQQESDLTRDGGVALRTYLLNREDLKKEFLNAGYIEGKEGDYGLVRKAVGNRSIPIYQREPDAASRKDLEPIGNINNYYFPNKGELIHPGSFPSTLYYNYQNGKFYLKAWDLNDYGGSTGQNFLEKLGANLLDKIGSPTVVTSGFLEISNDAFQKNYDKLSPFVEKFFKSKGLIYDWMAAGINDKTPVPRLPEIVVTNKSKKYAEGGYVRELNNHPVSFDEEGNLTDLVTGEKGTMMLPEFTVRGVSPETRAKNYSSAYHPEDALEFFDIVTRPITAPITPSTLIGAIRNALNGGSYYKSLMGIEPNLGITTENFNKEHPYLSMGANLGFDVVVPFTPKAIKGGITVAKELPYLFPKARLYSDNPFINAYATLARRYDLPDKARLPYLIRKVKAANLNFTEDGLLDLTGNRWKHANFTYDLGVIPHGKGSWDDAALTLIINPRDFIKRNKWGSIEPSDMFTIDNTTPIFPNEVINITATPMSKNLSKSHGILTFSSLLLENIDLKSKELADRVSKMSLKERLANSEARTLKSRLANRERYDAILDIINKFGRPKVKDVRLLEETTGLKSYIHPIEDALKFRAIDYNTIMNTPVDLMESVIEQLPVFNNGRKFNYMKSSDYKGVQYPYRNFFYDPATTAESKFTFPLSDTK